MGCALSFAHPKNFIEHSIKGTTQGTTYSIKYYGEKIVSKQEVDSILNSIDLSMSIYIDNSIISKFNNPKTRKISMDSHLKKVIEESFRTYDITNGYFDITVMPLVHLWGFGNKGVENKPTDQQVNEALSLIGMKNLTVKGNSLIKKKKGISIDVNGIAQGYTVDVISDFLISKNIENFIVEIGGEIYVKGHKPNNNKFIVEVQRPYESTSLASYKLAVEDKAITTSGTYEKQLMYDGEQVSHHIDPKSGYPIKSKTLSVTVIAKNAIVADAIDNYLILLAPADAIKFVESQEDMDVYLVYKENNVFKELQSSGFNNYIYK